MQLAPVWAAASQTHLNRLQKVQNHFLCVIFAKSRYTLITNLHTESGVEYSDAVITRMIFRAYDIQHPLFRQVGNYCLDDLPFRIRC